MRYFDYYLEIKRAQSLDDSYTTAGLTGGNCPLDQQLIDLGRIFSNVEEEMYKNEKEERGEVNYKIFGTWLYQHPKKVLHLLINEIEKLSRPRREWLESLVWDVVFREYGDIEEIDKLEKGKWSCITHDVIRSL